MGIVRIIVLSCALLLSGCAATAITREEVQAMDFGPYPDKYEEAVPALFSTMLKDPYSARYRYTKGPYKAYLREAPVAGGKPVVFGYIVEVWVNAKNSFGGYTGDKFYRVFLRGNQATDIVYSNTWFSELWYQ